MSFVDTYSPNTGIARPLGLWLTSTHVMVGLSYQRLLIIGYPTTVEINRQALKMDMQMRG